MTNTRPLRCSFFMDPWEDRWLPGNLERDWWELMGSEGFGQMVGVNVFGMRFTVGNDGVFEKFMLRFNWGECFWVFQLNERNLGDRYPRSRVNCESPNHYFWEEFEWKDWCWHSDTSSANAVYLVSNGIKIKTCKQKHLPLPAFVW